MEHRPLGRTGLQVSEIGYGAWGIGGAGWGGAREGDSGRALRTGIEGGVTFNDNGRGYGGSERVGGRGGRERPGLEGDGAW